MRKSKFFKILTGVALSTLVLAACNSEDAGSNAKKDPSDIEVVFIPKMTGNAFFESGNDGAQEMAEKVGFKVKYDGAPEGTVANQVQIINSAVNSGADAIAVSSVSSDGLNQALQKALDAGIKVVTWDSDVDPKYRTVYINQGTPDILGAMLVDMAAGQLANPDDAQKVAWFYSSPTVPDQNSWVEYANEYMKEKYPKWEVVTTQFGEGNEQKSLQVGESILDTYQDIDVIICPDSTALPAMAQAAQNKGLDKNDVAITGFASPNSMRQYIENDTIENHGLWDVKDQGALAVYIAYHLALGKELKVGGSVEVPDLGEVKVEPNSVQGYDYDAEDSGIIVLPERIVFTKANTGEYDF
ncbi:autoinducer 2 ABC transporter substrate-binding protein LsrB [Cytobacillus solani]|uniref:Autoinducer 2-binding protein lsrB n=1 Tax=Cytobacillus solani TaxID=1637975 RepID=A0A0Q3QV14_9BACI|nr:autoinducer 2 ABC transporter substrate-binding protein LsrB [Cytobacillus solani]KOP71696.1 autoinducer 2-binding protein lsrB [Bacillus sp. FJAT-21945]KQL21630.1 autoinducer 2-binding protein lsrB [Cytobacillus solani]USK54941.1 autoinducer 2 ABC transporter substrate-binding protein LsrB [Cytobacillus solani]